MQEVKGGFVSVLKTKDENRAKEKTLALLKQEKKAYFEDAKW